MQELLTTIVKSLVDKPEKAEIKEIATEKTSVLELKVVPDDVGKIIGKQGRIISAIRTILTAAGAKDGKRVVLELLA
jgi:predicted RNA-binding protein YlqC (UPF0109 family)